MTAACRSIHWSGRGRERTGRGTVGSPRRSRSPDRCGPLRESERRTPPRGAPGRRVAWTTGQSAGTETTPSERPVRLVIGGRAVPEVSPFPESTYPSAQRPRAMVARGLVNGDDRSPPPMLVVRAGQPQATAPVCLRAALVSPSLPTLATTRPMPDLCCSRCSGPPT
jgi:hypothetical protein